MINTHFKCDKCGAIQITDNRKSAEQFWEVGVTAKAISSTSTYENYCLKPIQVCRPCLESFGIYVTKKEPTVPPAPEPPTVEELILYLIRRELEQ